MLLLFNEENIDPSLLLQATNQSLCLEVLSIGAESGGFSPQYVCGVKCTRTLRADMGIEGDSKRNL